MKDVRNMLHTILVPLDGSPVAEQGLTSACRLAHQTGATLSLVRGVPYFSAEPKDHEASRIAVKNADEYLRAVQRDLTHQGFVVRIGVVPCDAMSAILFAAETQDADLISICTHGASGLRHALLGSVAEAVLRRTETPILMTRAGQQPAAQATLPYRRILVPLDGTQFAETALSYVIREDIGQKAELLLLQVVAPVIPTYVPMLIGDGAAQLYEEADRETQQHRLRADDYLQTTGTTYLKERVWRTCVTLGQAADEILAVVKSENVDLVVLVTHGRHGLDRLIFGSVAGALLHHTEVPLLILPRGETPAAAPVEQRAVQS
jgi:nucleotide-binding universal stress UspA family protein